MVGRSSPPGLSVTRLRVFAAVVEQGGYSAAARSLGLSQPTVSFHVQALERAFGTSLLVYRERRVHLTAAGEAVYALASRTLRDVRELSAQISGLNAGHAGRVRLGASIAFEQAFFFTAVVAPFASAHPAAEISLRFGTSRQMVEAVRAREADLGYVMHCYMPPDVRYVPLHGSRVVFFVAGGHPLAAQPASPDRLAAAGLITAPLDSAEWEYYGQALRDVGLHSYQVALEISGIQARVLAAQAGLGVLPVFWPPYAGRAALPGLRRVLAAEELPGGPGFGLVERAEEPASRSVTALAAWLRQVTGDGP
ncbi:MAG: LysR family transcriptional regulator, partial [Actinobacteria bacterium]|nr:LysR family transcriptional regulator [Actinomycetota bacterium]